MLKFGAVELFKDDSNTDQHLEGLDLDTVLKEAETRVQEEEAGAGHELLSQFKVRSFSQHFLFLCLYYPLSGSSLPSALCGF